MLKALDCPISALKNVTDLLQRTGLTRIAIVWIECGAANPALQLSIIIRNVIFIIIWISVAMEVRSKNSLRLLVFSHSHSPKTVLCSGIAVQPNKINKVGS